MFSGLIPELYLRSRQIVKEEKMILRILIGAAIISGLLGIYGFVQFVRYRSKGQEAKENFYKNYIGFAVNIAG